MTRSARAVRTKYDDVGTHGSFWFSEGLAPVRLKWKWGCIDRSGKLVAEPQYDYTHGFSEGLAGVKLNGRWRFIDRSGTVLI